MAKFTERELTPDDPIFHGGAQMFVPISRPKKSQEDKPSTDPLQDAVEDTEED